MANILDDIFLPRGTNKAADPSINPADYDNIDEFIRALPDAPKPAIKSLDDLPPAPPVNSDLTL